MSIRVLLVDDEELVRFGLRTILDSSDDVEVVGEAADGVQACEAATDLRPDVVLMDIRMPRMDGLEATRRILATPSPPAVAMLTTFHLDEHVFAALEAGAYVGNTLAALIVATKTVCGVACWSKGKNSAAMVSTKTRPPGFARH